MNMTAPLTNPDQVKRFVLAGNARITIRSTKTGTRFTYRIRKSDDGKVWFVSLLNGADNDTSYVFFGLIRDNRTFVHSRKSSITQDAPSAKAFHWFYHQVLDQGRMPEGLEVWHEGRCGRCARPLTVPESIESGFGPECINYVCEGV